jgi:uncharacterized protein (DUF305 family)
LADRIRLLSIPLRQPFRQGPHANGCGADALTSLHVEKHPMKRLIATIAPVVVAAFAGAVQATPYIADPGDEAHVPIVVQDFFLVGNGRDGARRAMQADLTFARDMARHHQGAVEMASAYLDDPRGTNPVIRHLARAIIHNQAFEMAVLDVVRRHVEAGPTTITRLGPYQIVALRRGVDGLEHEWFFVEAPPPSVLDLWFSSGPRMSAFDVQFARPMIEHHSAALDMATAYNTNPDGGSSVLGPLNINILISQRYEIGLLRRLIAHYPGDPAMVPDDPRMMEIMHRSMGGMHGTNDKGGAPPHH